MSGADTVAELEDQLKARVLIADGNGGRGRRLGQACSVSGIPCKVVSDGVAALDWALAECPAVVVSELGLPLVEAEKLSEILRANPRTCSVRFLFLGERSTRHSRAHVGDGLLPLSSAASDIVQAIEEMLCKQDRIHALDAASTSGEAVVGELTQLSLAELLERFHVGAQSGRLTLTREVDGAEVATAQITISEGEVISADVDGIENEKAVFRLLAWPMGHFEFRREEIQEFASIRTPTRVLLVEGMRQLAEWDRLAPQLPPLDARVSLRIARSELPNVVHPLTREALGLVEDYSTVGEIVDRCSFPDYQVLSTLHTLSEREIIELSRVATPAPVLAAGEPRPLLQEGQARRLVEWMRGGRAAGLVARNAKLLVVSSEPGALQDFKRLIESVPGVEFSSSQADSQQEVTEHDLGVVGRIAVDDTTGIELLHVPLDPKFAPLWPQAGYGALGTLFLLSGSLSVAVRRVRSITEALRRLPRSRLFHLIQYRKDERITADDLRDNLAMIDEASTFLLPLESGKSPAVLLGRLLARVIP